ncbi:zinc knuckle, partial [Trichinella nativa]
EKGGEATRKELKNARKKGRIRAASSAAALVTSVQRVCPFCEGDHDGTGCQRFLDAGYSARMSMAREKGVCYKCLKTGHRARECRTSRPCGVDGCRQSHHQLLHPPSTGKPSRPPGPDQSHQSLLAARSEPGGCLQTVRARAYGPDGNHVVVNCLFDTGAEVSFIRKDVAEVLGLTGSHERCRFTTLGGRVGPERKWRRVEFRLGAVGSSSQAETSTPVQALAIPQVCGKIQPLPTIPAGSIPAEPEMGQRPGTPLLIDVLIGIDYYYEFVTG